MGESRWMFHSPEQVNHAARSRVEALTIHDSERGESLLASDAQVVHATEGKATVFLVIVGMLLAATLIKFF